MPVDYMPYFTPVERSELARFRRESRRRGEAWARLTGRDLLLVVVVVLMLVYVTAWSGILSPVGMWRGGDAITIALLFMAGLVVYSAVRNFTPRAWERIYRRVRFADANGLIYLHESAAPGYPGMIFTIGHHRASEARMHRMTPFLDFGNYRYRTGSGKHQRTERWGYAAMRLPRRLPHMLLDAKGNDSVFTGSRLPRTFARTQVLSLEGDFDRHFTLYCPKAYERDALYIFTPDVMALLIDESAGFDVEIVDDWLFLYAPRGLNLDDPTVVERVFRIVDTVGTKAVRQSSRYADERIGDPRIDLVAPRGQRLRSGPGPISLASLGVVAAVTVMALSRLAS